MVMTFPLAVDLGVRLVEWGIPTRAQGDRPTCSVFTVVGALEYAIAIRRGVGTHLSVDFLNWASRQATGRKEDGGFFWQLWKGYQTYGICEERLMPYEPVYNPQRSPSDEALENAQRFRGMAQRICWIKEWDPKTGLTDDQLAEIKRTLAEEFPVCGGFRWPQNATWTEGVLDMCAPDEVFDGHSVLLVGYDERTHVFGIRNSGSPSREGALSYEYVLTYMNDALVVLPE